MHDVGFFLVCVWHHYVRLCVAVTSVSSVTATDIGRLRVRAADRLTTGNEWPAGCGTAGSTDRLGWTVVKRLTALKVTVLVYGGCEKGVTVSRYGLSGICCVRVLCARCRCRCACALFVCVCTSVSACMHVYACVCVCVCVCVREREREYTVRPCV